MTLRAFLLLLLAALAACAPAPLPDAPERGRSVAIELDPASQRVTVDDPSPTVSAVWDRALQEALVRKSPGPTISARAFAVLHTALYDAWAGYDEVALTVSSGAAMRRQPGPDPDARKAEAMSHAAHRVLTAMFPEYEADFDLVMEALGHDPDPGELRDRPAGFGMVTAARVRRVFAADGSNWDDEFEDPGGYAPVNPGPLQIRDIARWTPENTPIDPETPDPDQEYYTPHWGGVTPFALPRGDALRPPPPQPFWAPGVEAELDVESGTVRLADGRVLPVTRELVGPVINPGFIEQAEQVIDWSAGLDDRRKMIAEFWEDALDTAFPPGTWMVFAQYVSARDDHSLDEDAKLFLMMATALHDAGIAVWDAKTHYDYVRPVRAIRTLGRLGLIGAPGVDELTGEEGRVIRAWAGPGQGTRTILAETFLSYQDPDEDPSPPFAEYPSGHSGFSGAAAEVLRAFTGSDRFGAEVRFAPGSSRFEPGVTPSAEVVLRWETFTEAAAEAGASRRWGGIHFLEGDLRGREMGRAIGRLAVERARALVKGRQPAR
jgi:hypothetical protein